MTDRNSPILERWRNYIRDHDPEYECMKHHKKSIINTRPQSRLSVFWSFVSLFYIYGDISIGIRDNQTDTVSEVVVWGIPFVGITETTFLSIVFIMTLYYSLKSIFSIIRVHIFCNSLMAFKEVISLSSFDIGWKGHEQTYRNLKAPVGISLSGHLEGNPQITERKDEEYVDKREVWLFMMEYRLMGFLEYFFAPIIFPSILAFWALCMLAMEVFS